MYRALQTDFESLPQVLAVRAGEIGDERFVRDAHQEWSYGEFHQRVTEVAAGLRELGVEQGDVVGVVLPNSPHYLEVWWAILWLGAIFNPVNPVLTGREAAGILADSEAVCVVCTNPACGKTVPLPPDAPAGKVYGCPHCKQPLPPTPAPATGGSGGGWILCAVVTLVIAVAHLGLFLAAPTAIQQAAASAAAGAWTVTVYVLARCFEKASQAHRQPK